MNYSLGCQGEKLATLTTLDVDALVVGQDQDEIGGGFDPAQSARGTIDELRIWEKIRSETEINDKRGAPLRELR